MHFTVLGPVEVTERDRRVAIGGARQRRLLCALLAARGGVVSVDRLAEEIWDDDERPHEPARAVRSYVARLRRALGNGATVILTKAPGYLFDVGDHTVDAAEFERLIEAAQDGSAPAARAAVLRSALRLWHGRAYDEFADLEWIRPEVQRLERLRMAVTEELFEAELAQGADASLLADVELEVERFPFNERLRELLMEALWRAGRPVDAVRGFREFRDFLAADTGLDPSESLYRLERAILAGAPPDAHLTAPTRTASRWPSGIVTFLMSQIVDAESLWAQDPVGMDECVHLHDELIERVVDSSGGRLVRTSSDGAFAVFHSPVDAARAAVEAQALLNSRDWSVGDLPVRMGLHTDVAYERDGDYRGPVVHRTARLASAGRGGHILASAFAAELISEGEHELRDLGRHRLEDLTVAEHIWQVVVPGLDVMSELVHTNRVVAGNLPAETTSFVGRRREIDGLVDLLGTTRLLTLTGPGGSGKTRLAIQVAGRVSSRFPGGVWLVDLSAISAPHLVADAVAQTLGLSRTEELSSADLVISTLEVTPVLLILDTCERVIDGVADMVDTVLNATSAVTVIATSREVLDLPAETARVVGSLGADAVELFRDRAATTTAAFVLTTENLAVVEEICGRVDGMPLAVELAAARVATLDLKAIATEVDSALGILGGRGRGRAERHRTLETTIAWSHDALDSIDRSLFDRLSVFSGSFATTAVQGTCTDALVAEADIGDRLERLARKSMIEMYGSATGRRFRLLDTLRSFGIARLEDVGEIGDWRTRHATYYRGWVNRTASPLHGPAEAALLRQLLAESANIQSALDYAIDRRDLDTAAGLLLDAGLIFRYAGVSALAHTAERMLEVEGLDAHSRACDMLHEVAMQLFFRLGLGQKALHTVERGLAISETPLLISCRGIITGILGDPQAGRPDCERGWQLAVEQGDTLVELRIAPPMIASLAAAGNVPLAMQRWQQMSELAATYPAPSAFGGGINAIATVFADHDPDLTKRALEAARDVGVELGLRAISSRAEAHLAQLALKAGRADEALAAAIKVATDDFDSEGRHFEAVSWMHRVVVILAHLGRTEPAVMLHHALPAFGIWPGDDPSEHMLQAKRTLGANVYDQAVARGRATPFPELIDWLRNLPSNQPQ